MDIGMVGISQATAPLVVRESFSFTESQKVEALTELTACLPEAIILATCNRTEIYFAAEDAEAAVSRVADFLKGHAKRHTRPGQAGDSPSASLEGLNLDDYIFSYTGRDCAEHLFLVAGGIDSQIIGEDQILGQTSQALDFSLELKFSGKFLNRLFMNALSLGKKIRSSLHISEIPLSSSYIGILLLKEALGSFEGKSVLLIGAGQMSQLSLKYLHEGGLAHLYMTNRTCSKLTPIQEEYPEIEVIDYQDRYRYLTQVDALISATAAPHFVVHKKDFPAMTHPLYIMDLALPQDVDPEIGQLEGVTLYNLEDLNRMSETNLARRESLSEEARVMIQGDTEAYMDWLAATEVDPYIGSLEGKIGEIQADSMDFLNRKLDLTEREKKLMTKVLSYAMHRLTRNVVLTLKKPEHAGQADYGQRVQELFGLEDLEEELDEDLCGGAKAGRAAGLAGSQEDDSCTKES